jgi:hypothetical protein
VFLTVGALGDPSAHALLPRLRDAVKELIGSEHLAIRRVIAYLARDEGLFSREAILSAADAFGERGRDLKVKDVTEWLNRERAADSRTDVRGYYSALSHFFPHSSGFALIRHVRTDGKLRRRPAFPWARRSAVRIGCADVMAAHIADKTGVPTKGFLRYAADHLYATLTPTRVATSMRWVRAIGWRKLAGTLGAITVFGRYCEDLGLRGQPSGARGARPEAIWHLLSAVSPDVHDDAIRPVIDELISKVLASTVEKPAVVEMVEPGVLRLLDLVLVIIPPAQQRRTTVVQTARET